jgi:hypothetical protein
MILMTIPVRGTIGGDISRYPISRYQDITLHLFSESTIDVSQSQDDGCRINNLINEISLVIRGVYRPTSGKMIRGRDFKMS